MTNLRSRSSVARAGRVALAALVVIATIGLGAAAASAHANLVATAPAQSATYPSGSPPRSVSITFDEAVNATPASIKVYDGRGRAVPGATLPKAVTAAHVQASVPRLADGSYVVVWHVVSDDGHPEQGAFTFTVGAGGGATADIGGLLAKQSAGRAIGVGFGIDRALVFLGCFVFAGGALFCCLFWPASLRRRGVRRLLVVAGGVAIVATLLSIPWQAAYSTGGGASKLTDLGALGDVIGARFGQAVLGRTALLLLLGALVLVTRKVTGTRARVGVDAAVVVVVLGLWASFAYAGHGNTGRLIPIGFTADVAHLSAASLWLGGLVALAIGLRGSRDLADDTRAARRFSAVALPAIAVVVLSGVVQAWRQIGSWTALRHTTYGHLLVVKVLLVVAILIVASAGREVLREHVATEPDGPHQLQRGLWIEIVLAVVVLGVTSVLVTTAPGREAVAIAAVPRAHTVRASASNSRLGYAVVVQPAVPGANTVVVTPRARAAHQFLPTSMTGRVTADGTTPQVVRFTALADGRWVASVRLPKGAVRLTLVGDDGSTTNTATTTVRM